MRRSKTKEDKVAEKIANLVNDVTLDLEEVGKVIAKGHQNVTYNRLVTLAEAAVDERENQYARQPDYLF